MGGAARLAGGVGGSAGSTCALQRVRPTEQGALAGRPLPDVAWSGSAAFPARRRVVLLRAAVAMRPGENAGRIGASLYPLGMEAPLTSGPETAPALAMHGDAALILAQVIRLHPKLAARLLFAPARDIHARGAFVSATMASRTAAEIAVALATAHPRDLLAQVIGEDIDPRLFRLLEKCSLPAWPVEFYSKLNQVLRAGLDDALPTDRPLTASDVLTTARLLDIADPRVRRARRALPTPYEQEALTSALTLLDALGSPPEVPEAVARPALARHLRRALGAIRSPLEGLLSPPSGWVLLGSCTDLWRIGRRLDLCFGSSTWSASYSVALALGWSAFLHHEDHGVVAEFEVMRGALALAQVRRAKNGRVSPALVDTLIAGLRAGGAVVAKTKLETAIETLMHAMRTPNDLGDAEDEVEEQAEIGDQAA